MKTQPDGLSPPIKKETCASFYRGLARHVRSKAFYSSEDQKKFEAISTDPKLDRNGRAKAIFETVLEARLRVLKPEVAASIRKVQKEAEINSINTVQGYAYTSRSNKFFRHPKAGKIVVERPIELAETAIEYFLKIHELEHATQDRVLQILREAGVRLDTVVPSIEVDYVFKKYLSEDGTMALEWRYLNSIPELDRRQLIEVVRETNLSDYDKKFLERILENASLSLRDYLLLERKAGRYSKNQITRAAAMERRIAKAYFLTAPVAAIGTLYVMYESGKKIWQQLGAETSK